MKRLAKVLLTGIIAICFAVGFTACGGKETKSMDLSAAAEKLKAEASFDAELQKLDDDMVQNFYMSLKMEDVAECQVFNSTAGDKADEMALFKAKDSSAAERIKAAVEERKQDKVVSFEDYRPDQMDKINNAVIKTEGEYVFLCISGNNQKAGEIIDGFFK